MTGFGKASHCTSDSASRVEQTVVIKEDCRGAKDAIRSSQAIERRWALEGMETGRKGRRVRHSYNLAQWKNCKTYNTLKIRTHPPRCIVGQDESPVSSPGSRPRTKARDNVGFATQNASGRMTGGRIARE
jgi:hypothetical protein